MNNTIYDVAIIGAGVAGAFASYVLTERKDLKCCLIDFGRPPNKRRKQLEGWLGCFPNSNARLYIENDLNSVANVVGDNETEIANKIATKLFKNNGPIVKNKNKEPSDLIKKILKKNGYTLSLDTYVQWKPEHIHSLSREISEFIYEKKNMECMFDTEVKDITKEKDGFTILTEYGEIKAKKILLCLGRSGWRLVNNIYSKLSILKNNNFSYFGFRSEISASYMKDWNESHCSAFKDKIHLGPFSWRGTVIPEDHSDLVISAWRSNEDRWATDKTSFSVIIKAENKANGYQQTERLGKLAYILCDSRVGKLRVKDFLSTKNDILYIPEYKWITSEMKEIDKIVPNFIEKGHIYLPDILTYMHTIDLYENFTTKIENLYVAGESAGITGIYAAALSGIISASHI